MPNAPKDRPSQALRHITETPSVLPLDSLILYARVFRQFGLLQRNTTDGGAWPADIHFSSFWRLRSPGPSPPADQPLGEARSPPRRWPPCRRRAHGLSSVQAPGGKGRWRTISLVSFHKGTDPTMRAPSSGPHLNLISSKRPLFQTPSHWG